MAAGMSNIKHVVVLMFENRSLDNLLGWIYQPPAAPANFVPASNRSPFNGLSPGKYCNKAGSMTVCASQPASSYRVPTPDPGEKFEQMTTQIFGSETGGTANMSGFLQDYASVRGVTDPAQIMQSYSPQQVHVLTSLALNFAVSDAWFASCPCQTWPNRCFVHTGSSDGYIDNSYIPQDITTIFNVLEENHVSWGVFSEKGRIISLTYFQFMPKLVIYPTHFNSSAKFKSMCAAKTVAGRLPAYSFVEPKLYDDSFRSSDYHPPSNVSAGEQYLAEIYNDIASSPYRDEILFVIVFDEHGGCYDHVPPPTGATPPQPYPTSRDGRFDFKRFGVRVPAIVVSSWVEPGTVFRAPSSGAPYDHTSILATLRDWKKLSHFLPSPRIANAPTLDQILTRDQPNSKWPAIAATSAGVDTRLPPDAPLTDLQVGLMIGAESAHQGKYVGQRRAKEIWRTVKTHAEAKAFLARLRPLKSRAARAGRRS